MRERTVEGFALSPPQQHVWRLDEDGSYPWNVGLRARVEGPADADAIEAALTGLIADEEILRTGFAAIPGSSVGVQVIGPSATCELRRQPIEGRDAAETEASAARAFEALLHEPFELDAETPRPALRAALLSAPDGTCELVLVQPALCGDAASLRNVLERLAASLDGKEAAAPDDEEEALQYADLAEWLREMFDSEEAPEGLGFWRRVDLNDAAAARTAFESIEPAPFRPERVTVPVDPGLPAKLAARVGVEPRAVLFAAWQYLLGRHTERSDAVLTHVSAGRTFEGLDEALGLFQRSLPIAVTAQGTDSLAVHARRAGTALEEAEEWHELWDLERLRSGDRPTFLPYAFEHLPALDPCTGGGLTFRVLAQRGSTDRFRLKLVQDEGAGALAVEFDAGCVAEAGARVLAAQLATLLAGAEAAPETALAELELVSPEERRRLLEELATSAPARDLGALAHEAILAHAARAPQALAVVDAEARLTYAELVARASAVARHLADLGVKRGDIVGIAMGRSSDWSVAILGILLAGGAYLPLPPGYPEERIAFMLQDTGAPVVLTRTAERALVPATEAVVVLLDELDLAGADASPVASPATADDPAYVIYTSGSTGVPKGVPIPHRNLSFSSGARLGYYDAPPTSYLLLSSFAFDSSVVGIFWTLCTGGKLVLPAEGEETDIPALKGWIEREAVSHTLMLPSLWSVFLDEASAEELASLRAVLVAGESCAKDLVTRHFERLSGCKLYNEYGPTEGTVWCIVHDCGLPSGRPSVPIGRPTPGAEIYLLDPAGRLAPTGVPGEIHLGGPCVAPGYLDRPELSAERFVPHPFSTTADARLYRTGDVGRFLADGTIEFLGRVDHQVKIRGFRVEVGEIEAALAAHPGVQEVVVHAYEPAPGDKRLAAYVVGSGVDAEALRAHLAGPLPEYMIPAHFVLLDELPRLPNGKVDRKALPDPADASEARAPYVAPRTPLETVLAELWAEVLDVDRVGVDDDFFSLGGHSILATRLFARITDTLQVKIALRTLFEARTVARLAQEILADEAERPRIERTAELLLEVLASEGEDGG